MDFLHLAIQHFYGLSAGDISEWSAATITSFGLITVAEMGDKSQIVCMTLAARYRAFPVLAGAILAFGLLNSLAVIFGVAIASWFPEYVISGMVTALFAVFGVLAIWREEPENDAAMTEKSGHSIFLTAFFIITVAEFGDKTQLAVVALSSATLPAAVWVGATLALATTTALGVLAGRTLLQQLSMVFLHRISGILFLCLAAYAGYKTYLSISVADFSGFYLLTR
jgi:putative Ca2+/H+ antiporter (TMEM165/GDT1 family)